MQLLNRSVISQKFRFIAVAFILGFSLLFLTYIVQYQDNFFNNGSFWISVIISCSATLFVILDRSIAERYKLLTLFVLGLILFLPHVLGSPDRFLFYDELTHQTNTNMIANSGSTNFQSVHPFIASYPGVELITVSLVFLTGLSTYQCGLILIGFVHSILIIFLYLFFKTISGSERIAALGAFTYLSLDMYVFFESMFSYESLALCFLTFCLYIMAKLILSNGTAKRSFFITLAFSISALVITHHFTAYFLVAITSSMFVFSLVRRPTKPARIGSILLLTLVLVLSWIFFVSVLSVSYYQNLFIDRFMRAISTPLTNSGVGGLASQPLFTFPTYEMIIRRFLYLPLTFLFFIIGVFYSRHNKVIPKFFGWTLISFGFLYFLPRIVVLFTGIIDLSRFYEFLFVGTAFVIGCGLERLFFHPRRKLIVLQTTRPAVFILLIVILVGGIGIGVSPPYRSPGSTTPSASGLDSYTSDVFHAADWFVSRAGFYNRISTDSRTGILFTNYAQQYATRDDAQDVFYPSTVDGTVTYYLGISDISYLVIDRRISSLLPEVGYYFDRGETNLENYSQPVPTESLDKFDSSHLFIKVYDNGNINMYNYNYNP
jgi:hypothetical protein